MEKNKFIYLKINNYVHTIILKQNKKKYKEILNIAIGETLPLVEKKPDISIYKAIYSQLIDIQENIVLKNIVFTEDEIFKRYNLGSIAVKNFDIEYDEYGQKLSDIFGGSIDYSQMPEE